MFWVKNDIFFMQNFNFCRRQGGTSVRLPQVNCEMMMNEMSKFWVFDPDETFICYRGCLNLNCYMGKKVHKNFSMGLKIWWSWGSGKKNKICAGRTVSNFSCKTSGFIVKVSEVRVIFWSCIFFKLLYVIGGVLT